MKNTYKVAFGGILSALCVVLMFMTGIIPVGTFAFPAIAGILLSVMVIEFGGKWAVVVYVSVSILSFLFAADKEAALYFTAFLGFYPILKKTLENLKSKFLQFLFKFAIFNSCMVIAFFAGTYLLSIPKESFEIMGIYLPWVFLLAGNVVFVMYDFCISAFIFRYKKDWHKKLSKGFKI